MRIATTIAVLACVMLVATYAATRPLAAHFATIEAALRR